MTLFHFRSLPARWSRFLLVCSVIVYFLSACSFTRMETANQLEDGDVVLAGSIDNIGYGPIPRASFTAMTGVEGSGDISAHIGTTLFTANIGLGARYYLTERVNLSLQGDASAVLIGIPVSPHNPRERVIVTAVPRVTTATKEGEFFYGGVQANVLTGFESENTELVGALGGVVLGLDFGSRVDGGGIQGELVLYPLQYRDGKTTFFADLNESQVVVFQFSFGGYWW